MMPKLHATHFPGMELIRPMYLIREDDIKAWRDSNDLRFIQCACRFTDTCTTCSNGENHSRRMEAKALIRQLKATNPRHREPHLPQRGKRVPGHCHRLEAPRSGPSLPGHL